MGNLTVKESGEMVNIISPNVNNITSFKVHFSPKQEGSGDPSPNNVRPINGWMGIDCYHGGEDLYDINSRIINNYLNIDGSLSRSVNYSVTDYMPVVGGEYYIAIPDTSISGWNSVHFCWYDSEKNFISRVSRKTNSYGYMQAPQNASYARDSIRGGGQYNHHFYKAIKHQIEFPVNNAYPQGIYGGYVDLISGELVSEYACENYLWKDFEQGDTNLTNVNRRKIALQHDIIDTTTYSYKYCNVANFKNDYGADEIHFYTYKSGGVSYARVYLLKNADENTQIQFVIKLATPITYQLTPQQLSTLKGQNNFWSNADYVEIEYELTETFDIQKAKRKIILNQPHVESTSGTIAKFDTDMIGKIKECKINFLPVQSGSGDPSLTNIRPFSGWTGLEVKRTGKNLYDISSYPLTSGIWIHGGSGYTAEGASYAATLDYIPFEGYDGQTITLNKRPGGANPGIAFYDHRQWYISGVTNSGSTAGTPMTATVPTGTRYVRFSVPANAADIQLEIGSASTAYEPYKGDVFTKTWSSTVYGGYLNLVKGELVATEKVITLTGTESGAGIGWESYTFVDKDLEVPNNSRYVRGCSHTKNAIHGGGMHQSTTSAGGGYDIAAAVSTGQYCRFRNRIDCTTLEDYQTWLKGQYSAGTPVQIWARIIPTTYQLTPQQIKSLRGMNNISSNASSSIEVTFWTH